MSSGCGYGVQARSWQAIWSCPHLLCKTLCIGDTGTWDFPSRDLHQHFGKKRVHWWRDSEMLKATWRKISLFWDPMHKCKFYCARNTTLLLDIGRTIMESFSLKILKNNNNKKTDMYSEFLCVCMHVCTACGICIWCIHASMWVYGKWRKMCLPLSLLGIFT